MQIQIDTSDLRKSLRAYKIATGHDWVYILNKKIRDIAFRAASNTPKGNANRIRRDLMRDKHLRYALTSLELKKKGIGALPSPQFQKAVNSFVARRASSANYLRAGWAKAIEDLGGVFKGAKFKGAKGFANKATFNSLVALVVNSTSHPDAASVQGAELVGSQALKKAIQDVVDDMVQFAYEKMNGTARKFSAR